VAKSTSPKKITAAKKATRSTDESSKKIDKSIVRQPDKVLTESEVPTQRLTKTYLSKEELKHFQDILLQKRAEVLRDLEIMRASLQDENNSENINSSYSMHMADHGTETLDREQRFMFIARDERYLSYIDKALERIKNGVYGICVKSGLPIPKERLEAVPHTAVRIEYKNR
jgi:RNA polymerase-binding protein DksA